MPAEASLLPARSAAAEPGKSPGMTGRECRQVAHFTPPGLSSFRRRLASSSSQLKTFATTVLHFGQISCQKFVDSLNRCGK